MESEHVSVVFQPDGKRALVPRGSTILDAAMKVGVDISNICRGLGVCGKCQVVIIEGTENLSPLTDSEKHHLSEEKLILGYRLGCQAKVFGDIVVKVPEASRTGRQKLVVMGIEPSVPLNPAVKKVFVEMAKPSLEDPRADDVRLLEELAKRGFQSVLLSYRVLEKLPQVLREGDWKVTAVLWMDKLIDVEPGDTRRENYGIGVDIGTTKLAVFLVNLNDGTLLYPVGMMNPQIPYGEDVMSRISYAMQGKDHLKRLQEAVVEGINQLIDEATKIAGINKEHIYEVVVVGNTAMHHLFLGIDPQFVGRAPYPAAVGRSVDVPAEKLNIAINRSGNVHVLPNVAGFVGADAIGDILASELHKKEKLAMVMDVGTNTEFMLGNKDVIYTCSTASGPAFEGAHIKHGMRAATGAIEKVKIDPETFDPEYKTVDDAKPRGICGSGIIDVIAEMLKVGLIDTSGRIQQGKTKRVRRGPHGLEYVLAWKEETALREEDIVITQEDIREIQKAKAAMHAGAVILMNKMGVTEHDLSEFIVAGAFGSYIDPESAMTIGMMPELPLEKVKFVGNTAGSGARLCLKSLEARREAQEIADKVKYVELAIEPSFEEEYVNSMYLPYADPSKYPRVMSMIKAPITLRRYVKHR
ncbi:MAG: ferredoxin [Candidatus Methanomethylicota archaeon]|uniref:Ferredoxin n=1 Tax=Thermoproteota archaeon TaxID=2056631 RepID=A0A497ER76_9CREN|nr:MAG: ferredoxin [Candidatus Verstraetearchaeota archaeon]